MSHSLDVTVASGDALDVRQFAVEERMSTLFSVDLVVLCANPNIDFDAVVGQSARFFLRHGPLEVPRFWTGVCNRFEQVVVEETGLSTYHLTIVPTLWLAAQRGNYRIFQQLSGLDSVLDLLAEWGIQPETRLDRAAYKKREYRVQYAESDFAFMSRMLEEAGISIPLRAGRQRDAARTLRRAANRGASSGSALLPRGRLHDAPHRLRDGDPCCARDPAWSLPGP